MEKIIFNNEMRALGKKIITFFSDVFAPLQIFPITIAAMIQEGKNNKNSFRKIFIQEVSYSGVAALPTVIILGLAVGFLVIVLFPFDQISFGIDNIYGSVYSTFIFRELAPIITILLVIIRSTIAITTQLAQMKVGGELKTLEIIGINPIQYVGSIRVFSGMFIVPVLTIYFSSAALFSGMLTANLFDNIPYTDYLKQIIETMTLYDFFIFFLKTIFNGISIYIIAIYHGLAAEYDRAMIVNRTIRAITISIFVVLTFNILVALNYGK